MSRRSVGASFVVLAMVGGLACGDSGGNAPTSPGRQGGETPTSQTQETTVLRTLVYHDITLFPRQLFNMVAVMSANGERAVFAEAPGPEEPRSNHISVINADGSGLRE